MRSQIGDRVRLTSSAACTVTWKKNRERVGTVVRLCPEESSEVISEVAVLWDGRQSLDYWCELALEKAYRP